VRIAAAFGGISTVLFYTIAQMVGSGALIKLMFNIDYKYAELIVGVVMLAYVLFGGMLATTWVQIIKAVLLLLGVTLLTLLVLFRFGFDPTNLYAAVVARYGQTALEPGGLVSNPIEAVSLGLALMFGLLGLPHILMRFYTVPDAKAARKSVLYATGLIGYFYLIIPVVGFGAAALVGRDVIAKVDRSGNMAAPLVGELLAGAPFLGFIAAVAFATILAVVAGLTLAAASAYSHDIYVSVLKGGRATEEEQVRAAKGATVVFGIVAVLLGIAFEGQNVAFMVGLAFSIAASANFPALLMSVVWKRFTTRGAVASIVTGAVLSMVMIFLSPTVWGDVLGHRDAAGVAVGIIPLKNPAIVSMTAAFLIGIVVSLLSEEKEAQVAFEDEKIRAYLGVGAE
jgi:cation/acetate symporter